MDLSFVIPAHNEAAELPATLTQLHRTLHALDIAPMRGQIIVVNDASTDATAAIARQHGAAVVHVDKRQIAAVRNAGARQASGEVLIFLDADTRLPARTLSHALNQLKQRDIVGGGARVTFDAPVAWFARLGLLTWNTYSQLTREAAGCFIFTRRDAFEAVGGFDENYFASEELILSRALKTQGRFVVLHDPVVTSARKAIGYNSWQQFRLVLRLIAGYPHAVKQREGLEFWYDK